MNKLSFAVVAFLSSRGFGFADNQVVSIDPVYTYLLPNGFTGNTNYTFVNSTHTSNARINKLFAEAKDAPFISYDQEFLDILGPNPEVKLVADRPNNNFAFEMGVWIPERDEVWFTSPVASEGPNQVYALNLATDAISILNTSTTVNDPDGGYYFDGKVYLATFPSNDGYSGGVVSIDVATLEVETVVNSYFGLRYNGIDDIVWVYRGDKRYMFFTDLDYAYVVYPEGLPPLQLPANVYRYDPQNQVVLPVISRNEVNPNGVRVSPDMKTLYVTDNTATFNTPGPYSPQSGPSDTFWLGPYIYKYDLDDEMMPVNRRVFGMARQGIADGIHVDDAGRVYTAEYEGVVVRNPAGKTIGVFNSQYFDADKEAGGLPTANFALAGDTLVFLASTRLWTVKLGQTVVARNSPIVN